MQKGPAGEGSQFVLIHPLQQRTDATNHSKLPFYPPDFRADESFIFSLV
jgi:hypothetical protein